MNHPEWSGGIGRLRRRRQTETEEGATLGALFCFCGGLCDLDRVLLSGRHLQKPAGLSGRDSAR